MDGDYRPDTAFAVQRWKWRHGYPQNQINGTIGLPGLGLMFGEIQVPSDFRERAKRRRGDASRGRLLAAGSPSQLTRIAFQVDGPTMPFRGRPTMPWYRLTRATVFRS